MAYRSSSTNFGNSDTPAVPVPAGAAIGDIVIVQISADTTLNWAFTSGNPAGFALLQASTITADGQRVAVLWKRLTAADTGSYTWGTQTTITGWATAAYCYSGRDTVNPPTYAATINNAVNATPVSVIAPTVTALTGDDLLWLAMADVTAAGVGNGYTAPAGYTKRVDLEDTANVTPGWNNIAGATNDNVAAGATGAVTGTLTLTGSGAGWAAFLVRIPAAAGGTTPVSQTASVPWEATTTAAATASGPYDAQQAISKSTSVPFEAAAGAQATASAPVDAQAGVAAASSAPYEAATGLAVAAGAPWEATIAAAATATAPFEALAGAQQAASVPYEALAGIQAITSAPWEAAGGALTPVSATASLPYEAVQQLAATLTAPWEAQTGLVVATQAPWEAVRGVAGAASSPYEALTGIAATLALPWEASGSALVVATASLPWESIGPVIAAASAWWEALQGLQAVTGVPFEALAGLLAVASAPWEAQSTAPALPNHIDATPGAGSIGAGAAGRIDSISAGGIT